MNRQSLKQSLLSLTIFALILGTLQVTMPRVEEGHGLFPFLTLDDRTLPFFNRQNFSNTVYSWYALDPFIAERVAIQQKPFGDLAATDYGRLLLKAGDTPLTSPLHDTIPDAGTGHSDSDSAPYLYPIRLNDAGFRGPALPKKRPGDTLRIVAAGDSLTFGFGVPEDSTWLHQVEQTLAAQAPAGKKLEFINAGVIAYDSTLGAEMVERKILALKPDWVFLGYGFNDYNINNLAFLGSTANWAQLIGRKRSVAGQVAWGLNQVRLVQVMRAGLRHLRKQPDPLPTPSWEKQRAYLLSARGKHATTPEQYGQNLSRAIEALQHQGVRVFLLDTNIPSPLYRPILQSLRERYHLPLGDFRQILSGKPETAVSTKDVKVLFRVALPAEFREQKPRVYAVADYFSTSEIGATELNDEGREGDRVSEDGIYSAVLPIAEETLLSFRFGIDTPAHGEKAAAFEEEFGGWRIFRRFEVQPGENEQATPIYSFNDLSDRSDQDFSLHEWMLEICHPNSKGYEKIGQALAGRLKEELKW